MIVKLADVESGTRFLLLDMPCRGRCGCAITLKTPWVLIAGKRRQGLDRWCRKPSDGYEGSFDEQSCVEVDPVAIDAFLSGQTALDFHG